MTVKFRLKIGVAEAEFEGDMASLKTEIPSIIAEIAKAFGNLPNELLQSNDASEPASGAGAVTLDLSTNTIASVIDARTGPDLALAAAAHLTLVRGQDRFSRKELLSEMQTAATFYNQNYSGNLSKILNNLTRGKRLNLVGTNTFALARGVREEMAEKVKNAA